MLVYYVVLDYNSSYNVYTHMSYVYIYIYIIIIYIYIYILSSSRKSPYVLLFYGFHRRDSRGPVAAGNHKKEPTTETIKRNVPCHDGNHKRKQRRKP